MKIAKFHLFENVPVVVNSTQNRLILNHSFVWLKPKN